MANNVEELKLIKQINGSVVLVELNEGTSFPYSVSTIGFETANACVVYNTDAAGVLVLEFVRPDLPELSVTIPAGGTWYDYTGRYTSVKIGASTSSTSYLIHVKQGDS